MSGLCVHVDLATREQAENVIASLDKYPFHGVNLMVHT
jgi:hypothetical protein